MKHLSATLLLAPLLACAADTNQLKDKTLVVWAAPANLTQRAGSALTIDDEQSHFDGIVFGEITPRKWMAICTNVPASVVSSGQFACSR